MNIIFNIEVSGNPGSNPGKVGYTLYNDTNTDG